MKYEEIKIVSPSLFELKFLWETAGQPFSIVDLDWAGMLVVGPGAKCWAMYFSPSSQRKGRYPCCRWRLRQWSCHFPSLRVSHRKMSLKDAPGGGESH